MKSIVLLGADGQVGFELRRALAPLGPLVCATRRGELAPGLPCERADLADPAALTALLARHRPRLIVNAAAHTAVDRAEDEATLAHRVNAAAVGEIGQWAAQNGAVVLHYSTDYVFGGDANVPYRETDATAPLGVYGTSKLAGEQALAASGADHLILRTAWVYAARGRNFLLSMLRLAAERDELTVVADQQGAPTPAAVIAAASAAILARWLPLADEARRAAGGIHHLTCRGHCSWQAFAAAIVARAHAMGLLPRSTPVRAITSAEYPTRAARPQWSVLDLTRVEQTFGLQLPPWQAGLDLVLADLAGTRAAS
ncbi:MAG TPA: dTDP-4-dehydrorhamnose reductase [Rhodanobacteraceae bacterium]|nr:dTDP-4-dehydrorhamnose reductase [Rhodanobacteraceae bacterium]